ncbi:MAG TPA: hypothetical protein VJ728_06630, partial [Candidatus Binataceae bacterium]|nr:hypothetical protein [Candidatus Binataceae bacterium]
GAKPGENRMEGKSSDEMAKMGSRPTVVNNAGEIQSGGGPKSEIPEKYGRADQSGLTREVKDSGAQTFDFDLED